MRSGSDGGPPAESGRGARGTVPTVIALLGPTGVGKTGVAVEVARVLGTRVISCDSMQIYRGFVVLTNQPTETERHAVPHELVGVVDAGTAFSAAEYAALARPLVERELASTGAALLAGGTGLYMRAALAPLAVAAAADPAVRQRLEERAAVEGGGALHAELARLDAAAAGAIDPRNVRRVIRALEAVTVSGAAWSGRDDLWTPRYYHRTAVVGLTLDREELYRRIDARSAAIFDGGAVEEVSRFRAGRDRAASTPGGQGICSAIGYPEICRYLDGELSREEVIAQIAASTRKYARRQLTWLRRLEGAVMIDVGGRGAKAVAEDILGLYADSDRVKEAPRG